MVAALKDPVINWDAHPRAGGVNENTPNAIWRDSRYGPHTGALAVGVSQHDSR